MNLKKVMLELSVSEVQEILMIDMDEDAGERPWPLSRKTWQNR